MKFYVLIVLLLWLVFVYIVSTAFAASVDLPVHARIWNLDSEPIHSLAFSECDRHGFPCVYQCANAPVVDIVNACIDHELCCSRAGPHMDEEFDGGVETLMPPGVYQ